MIKETSQKALNKKSKEKPRPSSRNSLTKTPTQLIRSRRVQDKDHNNHQQRSKISKDKSKSKIGKTELSKNQQRQSKNQKHETECQPLHMKGNLKQLFIKHQSKKPKQVQTVPQILKNIQKNCKQLKKIHEKQYKIPVKRNSLQENKKETSKKKQQVSKSKEQTKIKEKKRENYGNKDINNRRSLQINIQQKEHPQKELFTNSRLCQKPVEVKKQQNFYEAFINYKKDFEIEDFKVSNKNTNYNTNQSKISSSAFNSGYYDHSNRQKVRNEDLISLKNIQSLIKSQQQSIISKDNTPSKKQKSEVEIQILQVDNEPALSSKIKEESMNSFDKKEAKACLQYETIKESLKIESENYRTKLLEDKSVPKFYDHHGDIELMEKKFENSKYYVQPIPLLKKKEEKEVEDSLEGCQIPLIENNVIQDSELISFEL